MKRSEKFRGEARAAAMWSCMILGASVAGCVWLVAATMPSPSGGMLAGSVAAAGLYLSGARAQECARLLRLAKREAHCEWEREVRPRL